jgi:hypothetical protein
MSAPIDQYQDVKAEPEYGRLAYEAWIAAQPDGGPWAGWELVSRDGVTGTAWQVAAVAAIDAYRQHTAEPENPCMVYASGRHHCECGWASGPGGHGPAICPGCALREATAQMRMVLMATGNVTLGQVDTYAEPFARAVVGAYLGEEIQPEPDHTADQDEPLTSEVAGLARQAYEGYIRAVSGNGTPRPWDELDSVVRDGWMAAAGAMIKAAKARLAGYLRGDDGLAERVDATLTELVDATQRRPGPVVDGGDDDSATRWFDDSHL